jgi:hypothetical protein
MLRSGFANSEALPHKSVIEIPSTSASTGAHSRVVWSDAVDSIAWQKNPCRTGYFALGIFFLPLLPLLVHAQLPSFRHGLTTGAPRDRSAKRSGCFGPDLDRSRNRHRIAVAVPLGFGRKPGIASLTSKE